MGEALNVNVNDNVFLNHNNNINDNVDNKYAKARSLDMRSDDLIKKFHLTDESKGFMYKAVKKLPESRIQQHLETVLKPGSKVTNPVGLFIYLCKRDGV